MPKPRYRVSRELLSNLKLQLENALGYPLLGKPDCKAAAIKITRSTGNPISESTLYRLFLWKKNENLPYLQTLQTISNFIGYCTWTDLEKHLLELYNFKAKTGVFSDDFDQKPQSLLYNCIQTKSFQALHLFFNQFSSEISLEQKMILGEEIYASLYRNPDSTMEFYHEFYANPIVRECFFEFFADPQFKLKNYEEALHLYLTNVNPIQSIQNLQDFIFANCLLLRHYFFTNNLEKVKEIGMRLYTDLNPNEERLNQIHLYPRTRFYSYRILFLMSIGEFNSKYWEWLIEHLKTIGLGLEKWDQKIIVHTLLDSLQFNEEYLEKTYLYFQSNFTELFALIPPHINVLPPFQRLRYFDTNAAQLFD